MKKYCFLLFSLISFNAYANCGGQFDPVTGTCRFIDSSGREVLYNSAPPQSQSKMQHTVQNITVNLPSKYGAIAQSLTTNAISSAVNEDSPEEAIRMAVANCESVKGNGKCQSRTWVRNACLSMAEGKSGKYYKAFIASSGKRNQAESLALKKCTKSGARDCKILMPEECSLPEIPR